MAPVVPLLEELEKITLDLDEIPKSVRGDSGKAAPVMRQLQVLGCPYGQTFPSLEPFISLHQGKWPNSLAIHSHSYL